MRGTTKAFIIRLQIRLDTMSKLCLTYTLGSTGHLVFPPAPLKIPKFIIRHSQKIVCLNVLGHLIRSNSHYRCYSSLWISLINVLTAIKVILVVVRLAILWVMWVCVEQRGVWALEKYELCLIPFPFHSIPFSIENMKKFIRYNAVNTMLYYMIECCYYLNAAFISYLVLRSLLIRKLSDIEEVNYSRYRMSIRLIIIYEKNIVHMYVCL